MKLEHALEIRAAIGKTFPTFGGGKGSDFNPIAAALKDKPLQFAAGVDVLSVIMFIGKEQKKIKRRKK